MTKKRKISSPSREKKIIIVGGGLGGVRCALDLAKKKIPSAKIVLINDKPHFEYHAGLYRIVAGREPLEVCIPLREILNKSAVELVEATITKVDLKNKEIMDAFGSRYHYDFLVLALGSETVYFDIPGLNELSYGFKSITEALRLKRHLHETFSSCAAAPKEEQVCAARLVIVGAGASGTELAGELAVYTKKLAAKHGFDPSLVTLDLIEAAPGVLPTMPEDVSRRVERRLRKLDVNIFLNRALVKEEVEKVHLKDMELKTETVIWTAGVKANHLYARIEGIEVDIKGRVPVDKFLQAQKWKNVFVIGDAAATPYSGMAQTAISDGYYVAEVILKRLAGKSAAPYKPKRPAYAVPVGPGWAAVLIGNIRIYGTIGWWLRRAADLRFFLSILPLNKAILAFRSGKTLCESCAICEV